MPALLARLAFTLALGAVGGAVFYAVDLPLPWMLGAMVFCLIGALLKAPVVSARKLRPPVSIVIGVALGSRFTAGIFDDAAGWLPVLLAVPFATAVICAGAMLYLVKVARLDAKTAYFSAMPGGLYEMVAQGGKAGADENQIALMQATRLFLVVMLVPLFFSLAADFAPDAGNGEGGSLGTVDIAVLVLCGVLGWPLGTMLRLPNAPILGPLLLSATAHIAGVTHSAPPWTLVAAVQVVLGSSIGGQFIGIRPQTVLTALKHGMVIFVLSILTCGVLAVGLAELTGLSPLLVLLALAPGGMAEMCLIALALRADVAFVTVHQLLRIVLIHVFSAPLFRAFRIS